MFALQQPMNMNKWFTPGTDMLSDLYVLSATIRDYDARLRVGDGENSKEHLQFVVRESIMEDDENQGDNFENYDYSNQYLDQNLINTIVRGIPLEPVVKSGWTTFEFFYRKYTTNKEK